MTVRAIHLLGSPVLREKSAPADVPSDEIRTLVSDLFDTMHADKGIGLAANQVGVALQVAVVEVEEGDRVVLINPAIVNREGNERGEEGCLSIPDLFGDVDRAERITVETTTETGQRIVVDADGLKARAIQHEIDHLNGVLFIDHLSPLKRRMLLAKWKKSRKGKPGYLKEVTATGEASAKW